MASPRLTIGTDPPADPATTSFRLNHMCLIVNDLISSKHFYGEILGMREILTYRASDLYTIVYMGYPPPGTHQTGQQLFAEMKQRDGLLELLHWRDSKRPNVRSSFSHLGLVVEDITAVRDRMKDFGVEILKDLGSGNFVSETVASAFGMDGSAEEVIDATGSLVEDIDFGNFLLVADPDGNVVEMQEVK